MPLGLLGDPEYWRAVNERAQGLLGQPVQGLNEFAGLLSGTIAPKDFGMLRLKQLNEQLKPTPENAANFMVPGIVKPDVARRIAMESKLPTAPEFSAAVANTPGASVAPDGLLMRVTRGQKAEQGMEPSVRGGVFYLPEGAPQMKHYSTGKNGYGGTERISGETLVKNPLFAKGGTGGKAPEAAYDSLMGKGSYQKMRDEALAAMRYGASHSEKVARVDEFLDKHAPEMSGMGDYIVRSSREGNQLPYALQEAAVSSAVRNAGHDAVIGYSKGKSGPFISELFDVREAAYPDKFGGYQLHDYFENLLK